MENNTYVVNESEFNLGAMEIDLIKKACKKYRFHTDQAAALGISEKTLRRKVLWYQMEELYLQFSLHVDLIKENKANSDAKKKD